jgi:hypothetical protein
LKLPLEQADHSRLATMPEEQFSMAIKRQSRMALASCDSPGSTRIVIR